MANLFFCVTSPLGVGIGLGISEIEASFTTAAVSGSLQGIACGTFLYVTFFEVGQEIIISSLNLTSSYVRLHILWALWFQVIHLIKKKPQ